MSSCENALMLRTISCRLYPSPRQEQRFLHYLDVGRRLYNHSLEQRIRYYKETGESLSLYTQHVDLTQLRAVMPTLADMPAWIEREALDRLDKAFKAFFRRCKEGNNNAGFPRFKSWRRWNSFGNALPGKCVKHAKINVSGAGLVKCRGLQAFSGKIKVQRIVRRAGKWLCRLVVDDSQTAPPKLPVVNAVGIDVGLESFATYSTGQHITNPRFYRKAERRLAHASRNVARKVKGSNNRRKAIEKLQAVHAKIANQRWHFTHSLSKVIIASFQLVAVERLTISGMAQGRFGKSILDAAWRQLLFQLSYKAESAGVQFCEVDAKNTSQECSRCGILVPKPLSCRVHNCPSCGYVTHRDINAAQNILKRAASGPVTGPSKACGGGGCASSEASRLSAAATQ